MRKAILIFGLVFLAAVAVAGDRVIIDPQNGRAIPLPRNPEFESVSVGGTAHGSVGTGTVTFTPGVHSITVTGAQTWAFAGWPDSGVEGKITIYVTNGGSAVITGLATPIFSGGGEPALTAAGKDVLVFTSIDGGTTIYGFLTGADVK